MQTAATVNITARHIGAIDIDIAIPSACLSIRLNLILPKLKLTLFNLKLYV